VMEMVVACFKVLFRLSLGNTDEQHTSVWDLPTAAALSAPVLLV